LNLQYEWR